jgi:hypothetical protein
LTVQAIALWLGLYLRKARRVQTRRLAGVDASKLAPLSHYLAIELTWMTAHRYGPPLIDPIHMEDLRPASILTTKPTSRRSTSRRTKPALCLF